MNSSLISKIDKARRYAQEPERITFSEFSLVFHGDNDEHIISFRQGAWHCSCDFFTMRGFCSHTMALQRMLEKMLPQEAHAAEVAAG